MKHEIIKTENYLLIVDESEIKVGDWTCNIQRPYIKECQDIDVEYYNKRNDVFKKVITHLPLNNSPILEGVDLLPPIENDLCNELATEWVFETNGHRWSNNNDTAGDNFGSFKAGYEQSEDRHHKIFIKLMDHLLSKMDSIGQDLINKDSFMLGRYRTFKYVFDYVQSLYEPKIPKYFESLTQQNDGENPILNLKTPDNVWIGEYIYEDGQ